MKQDIYTENLADFGSRERAELRDLLEAWEKQGLPDDFNDEGVKPAFNRNSGFVFLVNSEYQTAMLNGSNLESFYNCWNCGNEGFLEDCELNDRGCECCRPTEEDESND